jgi:hypothetical protein
MDAPEYFRKISKAHENIASASFTISVKRLPGK